MIARYSRPEMAVLWEKSQRFKYMLAVEKVVAQAQAKYGIIPKPAAEDIFEKGTFDILRIEEIEIKTKHDVIAFVTNVAESVGKNGKYVHFGMTSSDILDTALSLQINEASQVLKKSLKGLDAQISKLVKIHKSTLCAGRTHGMFAEPTTFGFKMAGFLAELKRNQKRFLRAAKQASVVKLSGPVGTFSTSSDKIELHVAQKLKLQRETIATQVVPRDRMAELIWSIGMLGAGFERLATELRHLQRTEVAEIVEGFHPGQKGSSAMPHKKNPVSSENVTGLARLLRSYVVPAMENITLWHERDISHSSVERVVLPDAFILADYATVRLTEILENLYVNQERMLENLKLSQGQIYSSQLLLSLIESGLSREKSYEIVQKVSHSLQKGEDLIHKMLEAKLINEELSKRITSGLKLKKQAGLVIERVLKGKA